MTSVGPNFTCDYCTIVADVPTVPGQTADMVKADLVRVLDGLKEEYPSFRYEIETPPPAHCRVQTVYMNLFEVSRDEPIVQTLEENFRSFTGRDLDQVGAVVTQSYAGNDTCHIFEAGIPCCLYKPMTGRDMELFSNQDEAFELKHHFYKY